MALRNSTSILCAPVDARQVTGRRQDPQVRYHFELAGERFTHGDATGRSDLWATLSEAEAERVDASGCVDIVYLANDPSVNRPRSWATHNNPLGNKIGGVLLVVLVLLLCGGGILAIRRVVRTPLWRLTNLDDDQVFLELVESKGSSGPVVLNRHALRRSILLELPRAMRHPPWRFPCDVLMLRTAEGEWAVGAYGPHWATLVQSLQLEAKIKHKRAG